MKRLFPLFLVLGLWPLSALAQAGGELRFCLRAEPKTLNPLLVADDNSEIIRYLTGGVLIRVNRKTQAFEPELAASWKIIESGQKIKFRLRQAVKFSDGTSFTADDVAYTFRMLIDPAVHSPTGDPFRSGTGEPRIETTAPDTVTITFPAPIAGMERLFDQVAIMSSRSPLKERAVLGPFMLAEHKPGSLLLLKRNPNYWKQDERGRALPYLDSIRLDIQQNQEIELLRFQRGQIHLINNIDAALFERLVSETPAVARDAGPSLESEQMWFNQVAAAPIAAYKKVWFRSKGFRRAISAAVNREDLCRMVYRGHATPAAGPVSPANRYWFREGLKPHPFDPQGALQTLAKEGFLLRDKVLRDSQGHVVEFALVTNAGNKSRERMAAMIQQDLSQIGIRMSVVTLDFPSLIERFSRTFNYEACLLGLVNVDLDPNAQMNVWLSSASNHQWNPNQKSPGTKWEAEIDRLMRAQASTTDAHKRKSYFDKVQEIVWDELPFIYLVNKNSLTAVSSVLQNVQPVVLRPQIYWNIDRLYLGPSVTASK